MMTIRHRHAKGDRCRPAMTLVELLIVIAVLCLLASLLMPQVKSALERARRTTCASNQRQMYAAWDAFANDANGRMPPSEFGEGPAVPMTSGTAVNGPFRRWMVEYAGVGTWMYWDTDGRYFQLSNPRSSAEEPGYPGKNADPDGYKPFPKTRKHIVYCPSSEVNWDKFLGTYPQGVPGYFGGKRIPDNRLLSYIFYGLGPFYLGNMGGGPFEQVGGPMLERLAAGLGGRRFLFIGDMTPGGSVFGTWRNGLNHNDQGGNFTDAGGATKWHDMYFPWGDARNLLDWANDGEMDPVLGQRSAHMGKWYPRAGYAVQDTNMWNWYLMLRVDGTYTSHSSGEKLDLLGYRRSAPTATRTTPW